MFKVALSALILFLSIFARADDRPWINDMDCMQSHMDHGKQLDDVSVSVSNIQTMPQINGCAMAVVVKQDFTTATIFRLQEANSFENKKKCIYLDAYLTKLTCPALIPDNNK